MGPAPPCPLSWGWRLEADNGSSSQLEPASAKLSFGVLSQAEERQLIQNLEEIRALRSPRIAPQSLALLEAGALEQWGLLAEAISLLERQHFQRAAQLAKAAGDDDAGTDARDGEMLAGRLGAACDPAAFRSSQNGPCALRSQP